MEGGYKCRRCGSTKSNKGKTSFHLRCKICAFDESVTAHTMFHKVKVPYKRLLAWPYAYKKEKRDVDCRVIQGVFSYSEITLVVQKEMQEDLRKINTEGIREIKSLW